MSKKRLAFLILPLLLILSGCQSANSLHSSHVSLCQKTIIDYVQLRDKGPIEDYQALFTQNATFNIPKLNIALTSSAQIAQRAAQAIKNKKTIHMITSTDIQASGQSALSSTAHFILYMSDKNDLSAATKIFNGRYIDSLIIDKGRCLIANRNVLIDRVDTLH